MHIRHKFQPKSAAFCSTEIYVASDVRIPDDGVSDAIRRLEVCPRGWAIDRIDDASHWLMPSRDPARRPETQDIQHRQPDQKGDYPRPDGFLAVVAHARHVPRWPVRHKRTRTPVRCDFRTRRHAGPRGAASEVSNESDWRVPVRHALFIAASTFRPGQSHPLRPSCLQDRSR